MRPAMAISLLTSLLSVLTIGFVIAGNAHAQAVPGFEVATIRLSDQPPGGFITYPSAGRMLIPSFTLRSLIGIAYGGIEVTGGPDWINRDAYAVQAQAEGNPSREELRLMLRSLLTERFTLKVHTESKAVEVYALVPARSDGWLGPNVQRFDGVCGTTPPAQRCPALGSATALQLTGQPMVRLAEMLTKIANPGRRVVDRTGLMGLFTMTFEFPFGAKAGVGDPSVPSLFTAVQEQLGLKLEPAQGTVELLVVDHAERPTEN
jgi:uncharacterized protein (TIGR03435 family)